ncbi:hypothetical protein FHG87_004845, partial [Trinorchestia longiramus]
VMTLFSLSGSSASGRRRWFLSSTTKSSKNAPKSRKSVSRDAKSMREIGKLASPCDDNRSVADTSTDSIESLTNSELGRRESLALACGLDCDTISYDPAQAKSFIRRTTSVSQACDNGARLRSFKLANRSSLDLDSTASRGRC